MSVASLLGGAIRDRIRVYGWVGGDKPSDVLEAAKGNIFALSIPPGLAEAHDRQLRAQSERGLENLSTSMTSGQTSEEMMMTVESIFGYDPEDAADDWWVQWGVLRERARGSEDGSDAEEPGAAVRRRASTQPLLDFSKAMSAVETAVSF